MQRHDALKEVQVGDLVFLRSGSPAMTVTRVVEDDDGQEWVDLLWFVNGMAQELEEVDIEALSSSVRSVGHQSP